ncbi:PaaX family transcriptional regulator C-terminal domain-containing protein [Spongiactinospora sp. TRM90649]|uniref:PaaX family transcriptional regulator C-terminal domain-containing protein n=1 Tax=Spongiactinospora sp. TRM90649 TaxID=3031114 RepID=UPI0023F9AF41|nr:PaaX family transcriptional regulator C-terminal domain-containing protein [Spongiactinospora sp. TRM90649]MDF5754503.1 PaaX family transcriptional regulator C-terminal domain-containing protein [Spongiactinospora sp. TRM90649]
MPSTQDDHVEISTRVLVESLVREDMTVDARELYAVARALGMTDLQVRLCVKRLVAEGQFVQSGRGQRAVLHASADARRTLYPDVEFVRFMYAQDQGEAPWDGTWHLVAFAVPESARAARDALREHIVRMGGAPLQGGLYVSANPWEDLVGAEVSRLGADDYITYLTSTDLRVGGVHDPRKLADRLWPLDDLAHAHRRLARVARSRLDRLSHSTSLDQPQLLTIAVELASEFTRALEPDPLLPPELLPHPWPGAQARELVARCWQHLLQHAASTSAPRLFRLYADVVREITAPAQTAAHGRRQVQGQTR